MKEGDKVTINHYFRNVQPNAPHFAGRSATIERAPNDDNSGYIVKIDGTDYQYQVPREAFDTLPEGDRLIPVTFKKCSHDDCWEFLGSSYGRAAVRFPEVIYPLDLDHSVTDLPQVRRVNPDMLPALRFEVSRDSFIAAHEYLYEHVGNKKRSVKGHY